MAHGLRCGSATIKYLLFFFNFLFTLCGLAIIVVGTLCAGVVRGSNAGTLTGSVIFIIVVGAIIFGVAFFGCCGAIRESHFMLVTFAILLMVIIICEIVAAVVLFLSVGGFSKILQDTFDIAQGNGDGSNDAMNFVNELQKSFKCCGTTDASFWSKKPIPASCCPDETQCTAANAYSKGCVSLINDYAEVYGKALGAVAIVVAIIEVLGVWFALGLAGEIKKLSR